MFFRFLLKITGEKKQAYSFSHLIKKNANITNIFFCQINGLITKLQN